MKDSVNFILRLFISANALGAGASLSTRALAATEARHAAIEKCDSLSCEQRTLRLRHARELLGKHYRHSSVRYGENVGKINSEIYRWAREHLPKSYRSQYQKIAQAIIDESTKNEFDPVFVLSIIQSESKFNPAIVGSFGEIGLMQIKPNTAKWIAKKCDLSYKNKMSLRDPIHNIRIGTAYLAYLRDRFDMHARLYIAAYNMGQHNVDNAQERNIWPKDYPSLVMKNYVEFYETLKEKRTPASS